MEYVNTLSKFGTKVADRNQRVKYPKIPTRFRVLFEGFAAPIGGEDITMDMKTFTAPKGQFEEKTNRLCKWSNLLCWWLDLGTI